MKKRFFASVAILGLMSFVACSDVVDQQSEAKDQQPETQMEAAPAPQMENQAPAPAAPEASPDANTQPQQ